MVISLGCQYGSLMEGNVNQRLQSREDRLLLLDFLLSELEAARMVSNTQGDRPVLLQVGHIII